MINIDCTHILDIAKKINAEIFCYKDVFVDKISTNSKEVGENFCFWAIRGANFDGNEFIVEAISNGATAIVTDKKPMDNISVLTLYVDNAVKALGKLAKALKGSETVIGITGSVGKTTVKNLTSCVLSEKYSVSFTESNFNNEIGVPFTLFKGKNYDFNVVEMGMRQLGEIEWLSYISEPEISIITCVGSSHLEYLKIKENVFKAKTEILKHTKQYAIIPCDNEFKKIEFNHLKPIFIGENGDCYFENASYFENGISFDVKWKNETIDDIRIHSFGNHNLYNSLFAVAIGKIYGLSNDQIKKGIFKYRGNEMREEISHYKNITIINDCYNASYESMRGAISLLKTYADVHGKNTVAVLGDMLELGEFSREYHYRIGELSRDLGINRLYTTGKYGENIIDGYLGGFYYNNKHLLARALAEQLLENDVVLFKASREIRLEKVIDEMKEMIK